MPEPAFQAQPEASAGCLVLPHLSPMVFALGTGRRWTPGATSPHHRYGRVCWPACSFLPTPVPDPPELGFLPCPEASLGAQSLRLFLSSSGSGPGPFCHRCSLLNGGCRTCYPAQRHNLSLSPLAAEGGEGNGFEAKSGSLVAGPKLGLCLPYRTVKGMSYGNKNSPRVSCAQRCPLQPPLPTSDRRAPRPGSAGRGPDRESSGPRGVSEAHSLTGLYDSSHSGWRKEGRGRGAPSLRHDSSSSGHRICLPSRASSLSRPWPSLRLLLAAWVNPRALPCRPGSPPRNPDPPSPPYPTQISLLTLSCLPSFNCIPNFLILDSPKATCVRYRGRVWKQGSTA